MAGDADARELAEIADALLEQVATLRQQCAELERALGDGAGPSAAADADPIRLVAYDMAVAGSSRDDVERYLEQHFGSGDHEPILDEVFGA